MKFDTLFYLTSTILVLSMVVSLNSIVVLADSPLGDVEVGDTFSMKSVEVETTYKFENDDSLKAPKLSFSLTRGQAEFKDLVHQDPGTTNFRIGAPTDVISNGSKLSFSLFTLISFLLVSTFATKNRMIVFLAMLIGFSSFVFAMNMTDYSVTVTIRVPSGYLFKSISLETSSGSLDMSGLQASNININACHMKAFPIKFNGLSVSTLNICSISSVDMYSFQMTSSSNVTISTGDKVDIRFMAGYTGKLNIQTNSGVTPSVNGTCTLNSDTVNGKLVTKGACGTSDSTLSISADLGVNIFAIQTCPLSSTWRDPQPSSDGPVSPAIPTAASPVVFNLPSYNDWTITGDWSEPLIFSQCSAGAKSNGVDVGGALNVTINRAWGPDQYQLASMKQNFYLRAGEKYNLQVDLLSTVSNPANYLFGLQICVYGYYNSSRDRTWIDPKLPSECANFPGTGAALGNPNTWTSHSLDYIPTKDFPVSVVGINLFLNQTNKINSVYFRNMKFTVASKPIVKPTLLNKDSELVNLRKPTTGLMPQDRLTCPHLQSGLLHWHDPATWNGSVPSPSSVITLPANSKVLISSCSIDQDAVYQKIVIPASSELIFSDSSYTMNIHDVDVKGKLTMGSSTCRMNGNIEIIFHGQKTTSDTITQYLGSKGIAVSRGGYISVQGKQYYKTWSRLAATVYPYESIIYLQDNVNWEVGQRVFITTSKYEDEFDPQNEEMTIAAINGNIVQFTEPLQFLHYGGQEYQAEVGLISRRIIFRGADDSDAQQFGGHVLTMSNGQFAGIQLTKMGQRNLKGRYPLHFHLAGVVINSYISDCSVEKSYYRCYTVHGTHQLVVEQNTAFDATGHCYYIEDGVEENNTIAYNLAAYVHTIGKPAAGNSQQGELFYQNNDLTQPADSSAGCYYITNAYNRIIGNAASGGWASYSFPNLPKPIGNFKNMTNFSPESRTTLEFDGNSAHSAGYYFWFGSCIYCGGKLWYENPNVDSLTYKSGRQDRDTQDVNGNPVWMRWTNMKVSQCSSGANHWGNQIEIDTYESHDNKISGTVFGSAWINNAIVNGFSNNPADNRIEYSDVMVTRQGFQFYDTVTQTIITNINFRNFKHDSNAANPESDNSVIVSMTHSDLYKPQQISATKGITFTNVQNTQRVGHQIRETGSSRYFNFIDWDGSVSMVSSTPKIVGSSLNWWNFDSSCRFNTDWETWICEQNGRQVGNIQVVAPGLIFDDGSTEDTFVNVGNSSLFGPNLPPGPQTAFITSNAGITGILGMGWYLNFYNGVAPPSFRVDTRQVPYGQYILLALTYPPQSTFVIKAGNSWDDQKYWITLTTASSQSGVLNGDGTKYYFDPTSNNLFIKIVNKRLTDDSQKFTRGGVSIRDLDWGFGYYITATCPVQTCVRSDTTAKYPTWVN
ncbi:hypothetical protein PPL_07659 [Heterostelium album PN500]|uniref:G8 domain-containing protein n=1 Tax=Heterostelium pallidum (strain ATCC 26659 / Pp 5 / PN500) TaxID=670386 RepID=D3BGK7_HETP5|nr:hypothetical protein PPL_07659 [Heterostelium album PN500]EFA79241.1 hypothetical protein PPL_07659 [Heterostelium album PN500]|eukprot:XP_020431362.1 hypothetical protein PPL_07659 [Heterostelium album PN500]